MDCTRISPLKNCSSAFAGRNVFNAEEYAATAHQLFSPLIFNEITINDIPRINAIIKAAVENSALRTCDFTIGGIFMWTDFFNYRFCIYRNTLFICGVSELDDMSPAFSLPIGELPLAESIELLRDYCAQRHIDLRFSAIPENLLDEFRKHGTWEEAQLSDWSDYLYDIRSLSTLSGKRYNKKRNHVNRFMADNPDFELIDITPANAQKVLAAFNAFPEPDDDDPDDDIYDFGGYESFCASRTEEREMTREVLRRFGAYPFEGAYLTDGRGHIVAFSVAEIIGDTAFIHIEKMNHTVAGAGETVNKLFAERLLQRHPRLLFVNREEDCGDPALRYTKESYRPAKLLNKFELVNAV